jgi:hypothetical protein
MSDEPAGQTPMQRAEQLLTETAELKAAITTGLQAVAGAHAEKYGHLNPDLFAGLLLAEVGTVVLDWAITERVSALVADEYFDKLLRRARRGFTLQLNGVLQRTRGASGS